MWDNELLFYNKSLFGLVGGVFLNIYKYVLELIRYIMLFWFLKFMEMSLINLFVELLMFCGVCGVFLNNGCYVLFVIVVCFYREDVVINRIVMWN